jgi:hypothetical protein
MRMTTNQLGLAFQTLIVPCVGGAVGLPGSCLVSFGFLFGAR